MKKKTKNVSKKQVSVPTAQERMDRFNSYMDNLKEIKHTVEDRISEDIQKDIEKIIKDFVPSLASKNYNSLEELLEEFIKDSDEYSKDIDYILRFVTYLGVFLSFNIARLQNKNGDSFQEFIHGMADEELSNFRDIFLRDNLDNLEENHDFSQNYDFDYYYDDEEDDYDDYGEDDFVDDDELTDQEKWEEEYGYLLSSISENKSRVYDNDPISSLISSTEDYRKIVAHSLFDKFSPEEKKALARFISVCGIITDTSLIEDYGKE